MVSEAGKSRLLRPPTSRMLSRRLEVSAYSPGSRERSDHSKPCLARHGRGMGQRNGTLAMPGTRRDHFGQRPEHAVAAIACLEKRQYLSVARGFHRRRAELAGCSGADQEVT